MRVQRLGCLTLTGLSLLVLAGGLAAWFTVLAPVSTVGDVEFDQELTVPPLARSRVEDGVRVFELEAREGRTRLAPGVTSETWGFNGDYLGPTLRAERGERVRVEVTNSLDEDTSVHWHGMHLPASEDGGPHQPVPAGGSWEASWTVDQPAATLWYHPHPHGETERHVARGLAGMFVLDDGSDVDLPDRYGVDDVPVIVQDKNLSGDGDIGQGLGDDVVVNGTPGPYLDVTTERVRLRLLNAGVKRVFDFGFSDDRPFDVVGTDGGLLPAPHRTDRIRLSPGERAEVVVEVDPGDDVVLRSYPPELGMGSFAGRFAGGLDEFDVMQLRPADELDPSPEVPDELAPAPQHDLAGATTRTFRMSGRQINGASMDMSRIDETVELGSTEVWQVSNADGEYHNFHAHDVQFQVLSVDGEPPPPELAGWKDTVFVAPGSTIRLATSFTDHADPDVPYMYHCHLLQHEDAGMMGQFVVVRPGDSPGQVEHDH